MEEEIERKKPIKLSELKFPVTIETTGVWVREDYGLIFRKKLPPISISGNLVRELLESYRVLLKVSSATIIIKKEYSKKSGYWYFTIEKYNVHYYKE